MPENNKKRNTILGVAGAITAIAIGVGVGNKKPSVDERIEVVVGQPAQPAPKKDCLKDDGKKDWACVRDEAKRLEEEKKMERAVGNNPALKRLVNMKSKANDKSRRERRYA